MDFWQHIQQKKEVFLYKKFRLGMLIPNLLVLFYKNISIKSYESLKKKNYFREKEPKPEAGDFQ